jgi:predicted nuclease of predicted toxin-antitoxin system
MRFLADENFPWLTVKKLCEQGHDVIWIKTLCPGSSDEQVIRLAQQQQRVLLTFDKDFGELVFRKGQGGSHGVVLFRIPLLSAEQVTQMIVLTLNSRSDWEGQFSVVKETHIRIRPLPVFFNRS